MADAAPSSSRLALVMESSTVLGIAVAGLLGIASISPVVADTPPPAPSQPAARPSAEQAASSSSAGTAGDPTCSSASLWRDVPGPREAVTIGERTLHIPVNLPNFRALNEGGIKSAWFLFHIKPDGNLEPGGRDLSKPGFGNVISLHIRDIQGMGNIEQLKKEYIDTWTYKPPVIDHDDKFIIYRGRPSDIYIWNGKIEKKGFPLNCVNNFPETSTKFYPTCGGARYYWYGSAMSYYFSRDFVDVSPMINACLTQMFEDFSKPNNKS